jgi:hypothetical protein
MNGLGKQVAILTVVSSASMSESKPSAMFRALYTTRRSEA